MKLRPPLWKKGKTYKRAYTGSKRFSRSCRNHGSCRHCQRSRTWNSRKKLYWLDFDMESNA